ncbi:hypothetical protein PNH38_00945 [Anoxybacillus rupiensis]|jgi:hypothetical protein|uniref:Uncharacterized protein n=1 Tax=Anoxybacteroides rupiense TaxID=311460 RepID=A0ABD5IUS2_9BACL|nr:MULTISPECIES: hypothetical protein [Anoxybacillus]KXG11122.1 hypothetical protein AT864_00205 [Anoxybacillus sp. P3H1B]MBB3906698.1 hypothetical protein [Anoxybacillus rupiensis]MBS2770181.1 hypothetical protein [Anoxybacillus rupiensis]MDE8562444.1 hypothetical protein [Anoxybacillus rupiensis]MED5052070.1 hypothetical protein [Anoxybacillus rupiensis]
MRIRRCKGYELEKAQPNTSEDFFNRSEVTFVEDGVERTLHVLYVRYFDEWFSSLTPYEQNPIFAVHEREVYFKDIVALVCLLQNPDFRHRKRVYINDETEFRRYFAQMEYEKLPELFASLETKGEYELPSPLLFIKQPS